MNSRENFIYLRGIAAGISIAEELQGFGRVVTKEEIVSNKEVKTKKVNKQIHSKKVRWTQEEDDIIKRNNNVSGKELTALLPGRKYAAVIARKSALGVKQDKLENDGLAKLGQE